MRLRLAELIAALSLATDLGLGMPQEHVLCQCRIALGLADRVGVDDAERAAVYYTAMLAWVGCTADSHELAAQFGDEIEFRAAAHEVDLAGLPMMGFLLGRVGDRPPAAEAGADGGEGGDDPGARRRRGDDGALPGRLTDCAAPRARPRGPGAARARLRALGRQGNPARDRRRGAAAGDPAGSDRRDRRGPPSQRRRRRRGRGRARARRQPVRSSLGGGVCRLRRRAARRACRGVELGRGDRGRAGPGQTTGRRAARHRPRDARGLRRFEVTLVHRPLARRRAAGGSRRRRTPGFRRRRSPSCAGRRWSTTSGAPGCRTRSGTSPVR